MWDYMYSFWDMLTTNLGPIATTALAVIVAAVILALANKITGGYAMSVILSVFGITRNAEGKSETHKEDEEKI